MTKLPEITSYGKHSSDNYGINTKKLTIGILELFYSYDTIVAFKEKGKLTIIQNCRGATTGKHLNWIDSNKSKRIEKSRFNKLLSEALKRNVNYENDNWNWNE